MTPPVFVVGTGRCGSTMLSNMLAECPSVLMLSEFIVSLSPGAFPEGTLSAAQFWSLLTTPRLKYSTLIGHKIAPSELLYANSGASWSGGIPPILLVTLPFLTDEPEELFDWLETTVADLPDAPVADHYQRLLTLMAERLGRSTVIERSGGSLRFVPALHRAFPDARFVHLFRNGYDCARSMSRHASFRLAALLEEAKDVLGGDPFHMDKRPAGPLPPEIRAILPESFDAEYVMRAEIDDEVFGRLWSTQVVYGLAALKRIPSERVYSLRYEDLIAEPNARLTELAEWIGLEGGDWIEQAVAIPDSAKRGGSPKGVSTQLRRGSSIGMRLLGYSQ